MIVKYCVKPVTLISGEQSLTVYKWITKQHLLFGLCYWCNWRRLNTACCQPFYLSEIWCADFIPFQIKAQFKSLSK